MNLIFIEFKNEFSNFVSLNHESTKENFNYLSKNFRFEFLMKQTVTIFIMIYSIFQIILPNGFFFNYYNL